MLSPEERNELDELRGHYKTARAASVTVMKHLQAKRGWLSDETLRDAADFLDLPVSDIEGLATFYSLLYRRPVGRNVILLCDSISCWVCGCEGIREHIQERLGVGPGETTPDGEFTLLPICCLGNCDRAPTMMVGPDLHERLTPERVDEILDGYVGGEDHG